MADGELVWASPLGASDSWPWSLCWSWGLQGAQFYWRAFLALGCTMRPSGSSRSRYARTSASRKRRMEQLNICKTEGWGAQRGTPRPTTQPLGGGPTDQATRFVGGAATAFGRACRRRRGPLRGEAPSWGGPQPTTQTAARPGAIGISDRVTPSSFTAGGVQAVPGISYVWRTVTLRLVGTTDSARARDGLLKVTPEGRLLIR